MSKFKMKIKLEGFELQVEGDRDDAPEIADRVGQQFAGLLTPVVNEAAAPAQSAPPALESNVIDVAPSVEKKPKKPRKRARAPRQTDVVAVDWKHEPEKWGTPSQDWSTQQKTLYLLYVVKEATQTGELTVSEIAATFNKHFKEAGALRPNLVSREIAKLKMSGHVGEDSQQAPSKWYLTDTGRRDATELVGEAVRQTEFVGQ